MTIEPRSPSNGTGKILRFPEQTHPAPTARAARHGGIASVAPVVSDNPHPAFELTDVGNAHRFVAQHGHQIRCVILGDKRQWYVWDGRRWAEDTTGAVVRFAEQTAESVQAEAGHPASDLARWARNSQSLAAIRAMVQLASHDERIVVHLDAFDRDPLLLNLENGTFDLSTGQLRRHDPSDLITKLAPVAYDPSATCPRFEQFVARIMGGDPEMVSFIQRGIGYSLSGSTEEQVMFMAWGNGANGKSTLTETVRSLLGEYAKASSIDTWLLKRAGGASNGLARLSGARFVSVSEMNSGQRLDMGLIKRFSAGDQVDARFLFQEYTEYTPQGKLWFATNNKPRITDQSDGAWRRMLLVPFDVRIPAEEQDHELLQKLRAELPGILNWALAGYRDWRKVGLLAPDTVRQATESYRSESDPLAGFFEESCVVANGASVSAAALFAEYGAYCERNNEEKISKRKLGGMVKARGFEDFTGGTGNDRWRGYRGLGLKTEVTQ